MSKTSKKILKAALFIGSTIGTMYCYNKYIDSTSISKNKLKAEDSYFEWKYGNIYYEKMGEGQPLLLVHDFTQYSSSYEWIKAAEALAENHTVYMIDLLGCGRSDKPQLTYTNFLYVQLLCDFIKNVIKEKTSVITSGFSSSIAVMLCAYDRNLVDKLIFINPVEISVLNRNPSKYSKISKDILELPILGTFIYNIMTLRGNVEVLLKEKYLFDPLYATADMIDTYYESCHRGNGNGKYILSSYVGNYMNANLSHGISSINNDILIITGKMKEKMEDIVEEYKEYNNSIKSVSISKSKKLPHFENPEAVLFEIKSFL